MIESDELSVFVKEAIKSALFETHVCMPAKIKNYDSSTQKADVEPLLKTKYKGEDKAVDRPVINSVPVQHPSANGGAAFIHLPIKTGDLGWIVFADRSIDAWLSGGGESVDPGDQRHHSITDAIFIPGGRPFKAALDISSPDNLIVKNSSMTIELDPSGKIKIEGATNEVLTVIDSFMTNIIGATVIIASGSSAGTYPLDPVTVAALTQDQINLQTLKI